jgi:hypothetical protein
MTKILCTFTYEDKVWVLLDDGEDDEYEYDRFEVVPAEKIDYAINAPRVKVNQ